MPDNQSIKKPIVTFVLLAFAVLVVSYSILVNVFFEKGLQLSVHHRLELEAMVYGKAYDAAPGVRLPEAANFKTYADYAGLPSDIRAAMPRADLVPGTFSVIKHSGEPSAEHRFVYAWARSDGTTMYFVYSLWPGDESQAIHDTSRGSLYYAVAIGLTTFVILLAVAFLLFRHITRLVTGLRDWAFTLDKDTIDEPVPDFQYRELNTLAGLMHDNMGTLLESNRREQQFLRNASHELRTPIAVIQSNAEWLERIARGGDERLGRPVTAMLKAAATMKEMVSTLLWASRKDVATLPSQAVDVHEAVRDIAEDNAYLLANKDVRVETDLAPATVEAPPALARVIWSNIVRNAFQHTFEGTVDIRLEGMVLTVRNALDSDGARPETERFGLGIMLIRDLAASLGWSVTFDETPDTYTVILHMTP